MSILDQIKSEANYLLQTKQLIREAIINQGVAVPDSTPFAQYPQLVASIGGGADYRPPAPHRDGSIAGELAQIIDTKERLREALIAQGVEVPADTPFRKYAELVGEIVTGPSLAGLKEALVAGTAQSEYPVGVEIEDTYAGKSNPVIVVQYLTPSNNSKYGGAEGAMLIRKYVEPLSQKFGDVSTYYDSDIKDFLDTTGLQNCSEELKSVISTISVPYGYSGAVSGKLFLLSVTEAFGIPNTWPEGIALDYFKEKMGTSAASNSKAHGRIMRDRNGNSVPVWLRTQYSYGNGYYIRNDGSIIELPSSQSVGVLQACFISKN